MKSKHTIQIILCLTIIASACGEKQTESRQSDRLFVVTTTGMIGDVVRNIVGNTVEVQEIMGAGVDPHLYKATRNDLSLLREADIIFYNGLHLEGKMGEVLEKLARQKPVFAIGDQIDTQKLNLISNQSGAVDPHIWFDITLWIDAVKIITASLIKEVPEYEEVFAQNSAQYQKQLAALHQEIIRQINSIPKERRVLITAHDAFGYFGQAYDIEVRGLQGISTVSEFGLKDIASLVAYIVEKKIKAVFVESSIPRKSLEAVVQGCQEKGHQVTIGGTLYSDAMGATGTAEGTYIGMVKYNVKTIVNSLK